MNSIKVFAISCAVILGIILFGSVYTLEQGQNAFLLRLGEIVTEEGQPIVKFPGLHFKWPMINSVRKFDTRLQTLAVKTSRILTLNQNDVLVDYYIKWRIENLALYFQRTGGDPLHAQTLLQQQVNDALRAAFGQRTITDMVSGERVNLVGLLTQRANATARNLGINVVDVRIKSIDLPREVSDNVYSRMRTKREEYATELRENGKAEAEKIRAEADANATIVVAQAKKQAAELRAQGNAEAAKIYNSAYTQDPGFFAFYRSLEAYRTAFNSKNDFLVMSPDNPFFKYFNNGIAATAAKPTTAHTGN
jgi:membrane protease subunit HflC